MISFRDETAKPQPSISISGRDFVSLILKILLRRFCYREAVSSSSSKCFQFKARDSFELLLHLHESQSHEADPRHLTIPSHVAWSKKIRPLASRTLPVVPCAPPAGSALTPRQLMLQNLPSSLRRSLQEPALRPSPRHLLQPTNGSIRTSIPSLHTTISTHSMHPGHQISSLRICYSGANILTTPPTMLTVGRPEFLPKTISNTSVQPTTSLFQQQARPSFPSMTEMPGCATSKCPT